MRHLSNIELSRRALRATICPACYQRPPGSETLPPSVARSCEPRCALFQHIEVLKTIAKTSPNDRPGDCERAVREQICNRCCIRLTAGDYCTERLTRMCPLSRFAGQAVAVLEALAAAETKARRKE